MTSVIYLSGPIGNGHTIGPRAMYANVRQAETVMYELMNKGWSVICPHLAYHAWINWPKDMPWKRWMEADYELLQKADAFFYMRPEIYGESKGAAKELEWAVNWNLTIYDDIDSVPIVSPPQGVVE